MCSAGEERCGDSSVNGSEACDDGANGNANDGCNDLCLITVTGVCGSANSSTIYDANNSGDMLSGGNSGLCAS